MSPFPMPCDALLSGGGRQKKRHELDYVRVAGVMFWVEKRNPMVSIHPEMIDAPIRRTNPGTHGSQTQKEEKPALQKSLLHRR